MHFHKLKDETFVVKEGEFNIHLLNLSNASISILKLVKGTRYRINPGVPHQIEALTNNACILEVSTMDTPSDSYRVLPGDNQK
jgi:mannose-6-phosphate isomerase-like protein (cupin superfamily)